MRFASKQLAIDLFRKRIILFNDQDKQRPSAIHQNEIRDDVRTGRIWWGIMVPCAIDRRYSIHPSRNLFLTGIAIRLSAKDCVYMVNTEESGKREGFELRPDNNVCHVGYLWLRLERDDER